MAECSMVSGARRSASGTLRRSVQCTYGGPGHSITGRDIRRSPRPAPVLNPRRDTAWRCSRNVGPAACRYATVRISALPRNDRYSTDARTSTAEAMAPCWCCGTRSRRTTAPTRTSTRSSIAAAALTTRAVGRRASRHRPPSNSAASTSAVIAFSTARISATASGLE